MKATLILLLLAHVTLAAPAPEPPPASSLDRAYVTIPYSELRALWEAGLERREPPKPEPDRPPLTCLVRRAEYRLQLGEEAGTLDAEYEIEALTDKWQTIPLLGGQAHLDQAGPGDNAIVSQDGYALLTNKLGKKTLALHLVTAGSKSLAAGSALELQLGSATVKRLSIGGIPAGTEARVDGTRAGSVKDGVALFSLAGEAGKVSIELTAPRPEEKPRPPQPSHWQAQSQVLAQYAEGKMHFSAHLLAHAEDGSGLEIALALPPHAAAVAVAGDDLTDWSASRGDEGARLLRAHWKTRDILDRELTISYDLMQSPLAAEWVLAAPGLPDEKEARSLFAVPLSESLNLEGPGVQSGVAAERLPQWMRSALGGSAFVTVEGANRLALTAHWLPQVATAEAIVSEAKGELRLVADGSMQATSTYSIRHSAALSWSVELPKDVDLLTCAVDGKAMRPVQRDNGALELSLPAVDFAKGITSVTLVYAAKTKALDPVSGQLALELPRTPLFIEHLEWAVAIPGNYEITAIDGNVTAAGSASTDRDRNLQTICLRKDFCRGERPAVDLFYQRRGLDR